MPADRRGGAQPGPTGVTDRGDPEDPEAGVARLYRLATVLVETNEAVIRAAAPEDIFDAAVRISVEHGGLLMAWLGIVDDAEHVVRTAAQAGSETGYLKGLNVSTLDEPDGRGPTGTAARTGEPVICNDIASDESMRPWWGAAAQAGYRSSGAFPLRVEGRVAGVLSVYASEAGFFDAEERRLVERLAANVAYGWESLERDARRRVGEAALLESAERAQARAAQQAAVASLGRQALTELDTDGLLNAAAVALSSVLGVELVGVLELEPAGSELRLRAGVGWSDGLVGVVRVGAGLNSEAGCTLRNDAPVVVEDLQRETRFSGSSLLHDHGVRSGVSVPIRAESQAYGVLGAHTRTQRSFTGEDVHVLEAVANVLGLAIARGRAEERIRHEALHDPLTGLPNRTLLTDRLALSLARLKRASGLVGVLLADLDRFKVVNDSLGHAVGDDLLVAVAARLVATARQTDTVARLGGDEFVLVCGDLAGEGEALGTARRISAALAAPFHIGGRELFTSASIGLAFVDDPETEPADVLRDADVAMYQAKALGGACHVVFDPAMGAAAVGRMETEAALRNALEQEQLRLHYQPVLDLASGRVTGAEALLRWEDPDRALLVLPGEFIPLAEDTGLIVPIGRWVLAQACRMGAKWAAADPSRSLSLSVNLSGRQFSDPMLVETVERCLADSGLHAGSLILEITETALVQDADAASSLLGRLTALGVRIAVDDFGTGQSSLAYLKRFPIDLLKIDRTFVSGLGIDVKDSAIVAGTISLAHSLGLSVVAEGVETREQLGQLRALSCDAVQGFLIARPVPAEEHERFLLADARW